MATSQNGWPVLQPDSSKLYTWVIPAKNGTFKLRTRNGSAGFLLAHFALWFSETIEDVSGKVLDDWGYALRTIRGQTTGYSNHASGTAIDLNSLKYPLGRRVMAAWKKVKIKARLLIYRGCLRSGVFYQNRADEMHTEINKPFASVEATARRLSTTSRGVRLLKANPTQKKIIFS